MPGSADGWKPSAQQLEARYTGRKALQGFHPPLSRALEAHDRGAWLQAPKGDFGAEAKARGTSPSPARNPTACSKEKALPTKRQAGLYAVPCGDYGSLVGSTMPQ